MLACLSMSPVSLPTMISSTPSKSPLLPPLLNRTFSTCTSGTSTSPFRQFTILSSLCCGVTLKTLSSRMSKLFTTVLLVLNLGGTLERSRTWRGTISRCWLRSGGIFTTMSPSTTSQRA
uniref:Uncharacterized protein n=1 Tax=Opuntia streptacantha TaxID=393608 RepID=A0A7C9D9V4_OPUST